MDFRVEETDLQTALQVLEALPEFDTLKPENYYQETLHHKAHLILTARNGSDLLGCKIGYDKFTDGSFYSWLGGVLPDYRQFGVAKALAQHQEQWAREKGYKSIKFKTQNRHKAMLHFALNNGFGIYNVKPKEQLDQYRIELVKHL